MLKNSLLPVVILFTVMLHADPGFDIYFLPKTLRLDYFHTGDYQSDIYSFDEVYQEPVWAGKHTDLIDDTNLGKYLFEVFDVKYGSLIYSRGFCTIFGEWQTTDQARKIKRTFSESIRFPWPRSAVKVVFSKRDSVNEFQQIWSIELDPAEVNYIRQETMTDIPITPLMIHGEPREKVDVVMLPDGYTEKEMKKFHRDAKRLLKELFSTEPFKTHKKKFNVRTVDLPSNESGIDNPRKGIYKDNALAGSFNAFGSDRYVLTWDNKTIRKAAARVPYEHIYILINSTKYGGGGIFNLYSTCVSDNKWSEYIFVHEFGHSFGGLGDEYYTSETAYNDFYPPDVEPWEPNLTTAKNPDQLKWRDLLEPGTQVPTNWNKSEFDSTQSAYRRQRNDLWSKKAGQEEIDLLIQENDHWVHDFLRCNDNWGKVGVYEGGGYASKGIYRPYLDCRMFTRSLTGFDPVCSRALENIIELYSE